MKTHAEPGLGLPSGPTSTETVLYTISGRLGTSSTVGETASRTFPEEKGSTCKRSNHHQDRPLKRHGDQ